MNLLTRARGAFDLLMRGEFSPATSVKLANGLSIYPRYLTETQALNLSGIWCAINLLSGNIASLPMQLFERVEYKGTPGKIPATKHPLYQVLKYRPNPFMTAYSYKQAIVANLELDGVAYIFVHRPSYSEYELYPLVSSNTSKIRIGDKTVYRTTLNDKQFEIDEWQVMQIMGLTFDGRNPVNPILKRRRSLALASAAEEQATNFYKHGTQFGGIITLSGNPKDEELKRFRKNWNETYEGISNLNKTGILYGGAQFKELKFTAEEMQMLDTRKFSVTEIARWFNVPPHKLKDLERSTNNNIEHQSIEYVQDSITPRITNIEEAHEWYLLAPSEREKYLIDFNVNGMLRGDIKSRMEAYQLQRQNGALNANEWRMRENMNPINHESGDMYLVPLNMSPMDKLGSLYDEKNSSSNNSSGQRHERAEITLAQRIQLAHGRRIITNSYKPLIKGTITSFLKTEIPEIRKLAEKLLTLATPDTLGFKKQIGEFYEGRADAVNDEISRLFSAYEAALLPQALEEVGSKSEIDISRFRLNYTENFVKRWIGVNPNAINKVIDTAIENQENIYEALDSQLTNWETNIPANYERNESVKMEGAFSRAVWIAATIANVTWATMGKKPCPYCSQLNGRQIPIIGEFMASGESLESEEHGPLQVSNNIRHPGLHDGCECQLLPG